MANITIIYHSGRGHTKRLAESVFTGVRLSENVNASMLSINEFTEKDWETLNEADAIIFGTPTYMGGVSAEFKKFADSTSKIWYQEKWKNKISAGFTNSSSMNGDKLSSLQYLWTLAQQHGMIWVGLGLLPSSTKAATRNDVNYLGSFSGLFSQSPSDSSAEEGPLGDLKTAELFGTRVSELTKQFVRGKI